MICRECGKELKEGNTFCTNCGARVPDEGIKKIEDPLQVDKQSEEIDKEKLLEIERDYDIKELFKQFNRLSNSARDIKKKKEIILNLRDLTGKHSFKEAEELVSYLTQELKKEKISLDKKSLYYRILLDICEDNDKYRKDYLVVKQQIRKRNLRIFVPFIIIIFMFFTGKGIYFKYKQNEKESRKIDKKFSELKELSGFWESSNDILSLKENLKGLRERLEEAEVLKAKWSKIRKENFFQRLGSYPNVKKEDFQLLFKDHENKLIFFMDKALKFVDEFIERWRTLSGDIPQSKKSFFSELYKIKLILLNFGEWYKNNFPDSIEKYTDKVDVLLEKVRIEFSNFKKNYHSFFGEDIEYCKRVMLPSDSQEKIVNEFKIFLDYVNEMLKSFVFYNFEFEDIESIIFSGFNTILNLYQNRLIEKTENIPLEIIHLKDVNSLHYKYFDNSNDIRSLCSILKDKFRKNVFLSYSNGVIRLYKAYKKKLVDISFNLPEDLSLINDLINESPNYEQYIDRIQDLVIVNKSSKKHQDLFNKERKILNTFFNELKSYYDKADDLLCIMNKISEIPVFKSQDYGYWKKADISRDVSREITSFLNSLKYCGISVNELSPKLIELKSQQFIAENYWGPRSRGDYAFFNGDFITQLIQRKISPYLYSAKSEFFEDNHFKPSKELKTSYLDFEKDSEVEFQISRDIESFRSIRNSETIVSIKSIINDIIDKFEEAVQNANHSLVNSILTDDFVYSSSSWPNTSKEKYLSNFGKKRKPNYSIINRNIEVMENMQEAKVIGYFRSSSGTVVFDLIIINNDWKIRRLTFQ